MDLALTGPSASSTRPAGSTTGRLLAVAAVLALVLLTTEGWAPRVLSRSDTTGGRERSGAAADGTRAGTGRAMEAETGPVIHPLAGRAGVLEVDDGSYQARFEPRGFSFRPQGATDPLRIELSGVHRAGWPVDVRTAPWTAQWGTARREVAPGVTEQVTAEDGAVEWDVVLGARPPGSGDVTVTGRVSGTAGPPTLSEDDGRPAWRFALSGGGSVVLDEVVVKDSTGAEVHRGLPRVADGEVSLVVPSSVIAESSYPLTVDPTVSGPYLATDDNTVNRPSVAFDGTNYLVVWSQIFGGDNDILGARLRANGSFLSGPFLISSSDKSEIYPDVAWNGSSFLVAWQLMFNTSGGDWDIHGQRVSSAGGLLGGNIPINTLGPSNQQFPSVASDGSGFLVAWQDDRAAPTNPSDIWGKWVSSTGAIDFNRPTLHISTFPNIEDRADVAWNGSNFLVVWELFYNVGDWDVYGRLVSPGVSGTTLGSPIPISTPAAVQSNPAVASNGADFLVAWDDNRNGNFDIFGARLNASGGVVDAGGFPISVATRYQGDPSVAYNGGYLVAWLDERRGTSAYDLYAARVANDRTVQDPNGFRIATGSPATIQHYVVTRGSGNQWGVSYMFTASGGSDASVRLNLVSPK